MIESLDVKTTKSISLRKIVEECKIIRNFQSSKEGGNDINYIIDSENENMYECIDDSAGTLVVYNANEDTYI